MAYPADQNLFKNHYFRSAVDGIPDAVIQLFHGSHKLAGHHLLHRAFTVIKPAKPVKAVFETRDPHSPHGFYTDSRNCLSSPLKIFMES